MEIAIGVGGIVVGLVGIFIGRKNIGNFFRSFWPTHSIAIFGPKAAGKTTLIRYLQGKPLPTQHFDTFGAQKVDRVVYDLSGNETYFFRSREMYDVGGEHKNQWQAILERQNPHGIVYMVDTHEPAGEKEGIAHIAKVFHDLRTHKLASKIRLRVLLVLLNKCDIWGTSPEAREKKMAQYRADVLQPALGELAAEFGGLEIQFGCASLTHTEHADTTNSTLRCFAVSVAKKE